MSVFFNTESTQDLLRHLGLARNKIERAQTGLQSNISAAHHLLATTGTPHQTAAEAPELLAEVSANLSTEYGNLSTRLATLITADARIAYQLSTSTGALLNSQIASTALASGWNYDEAVLRHELALLDAQPRPLTQAQTERHSHLAATVAALKMPFTVGSRTGDSDSNLADPRVNEPLRINGANPTERGRQLLLRALTDTATPDNILVDEFQAFLHDNGNLTLVLPGVIDLSNPDWGYDQDTNSLRDLDQEALTSAINTDLDSNAYAQRASEWVELMIETGVIERGTPTALIGHSFGSDSSYDLAIDEHFNGELLNVTHVFGAGYSIVKELHEVPETTSTATATNIYDMVALGETYADYGDLIALGRLRVEAAERVVNGATSTINHRVDTIERDLEVGIGVDLNVNNIPPIEGVSDIYAPIEPNSLSISFEGGFDLQGFGHHQDEYIEFVQRADNEHFNTFLEELDIAGFTSNAVAVTIDVSRPGTRIGRPSRPNSDVVNTAEEQAGQ